MRIDMTGDFGAEVRRIAEKTGLKLDDVVIEFGQEIAFQALKNTPWDTGFLRASWFVSINAIAGGVSVAEAQSNAVSAPSLPVGTQNEMNLKISQAEAGDVIYFLNGANYARYVEYGTSRQRGQAYVRRTVSQAPRIADEVIRQVGTR